MGRLAAGRRNRVLLAGVVLLALGLLASSQWFRDETATVVATFTPTATATFTPTPAPTKIPLVAPSVAAAESDNGPRSPSQQLTNPIPTPLDKPTNLTLDELTLCWDAVPNADDYAISPNTVTLITPPTPDPVDDNRLCAQLLGLRQGYVLRLIALSYDNPNLTNSGWSDDDNSVTVDEVPSPILPTPANLKCKYRHICWEKVENAVRYAEDYPHREGARGVIPDPEDPDICHCNPNRDPNIFCKNIPRDLYPDEESYELRVQAIADPPFQNSELSDPLVVDNLCDSDPG